MIALLMLSISVFAHAESIPLTQSVIGPSDSVVTITESEDTHVSLGNEPITQVDGWGNADEVEVHIVALHNNPRSSSDYISSSYAKQLKSTADKDFVGTLTGIITVRVCVDYWIQATPTTETEITGVSVAASGMTTPLNLNEVQYSGKIWWKPLTGKYRGRKVYETTFDSRTLANNANITFTASATYKPQTVSPATDSYTIAINNPVLPNGNNPGSSDYEPVEWNANIDFDNDPPLYINPGALSNTDRQKLIQLFMNCYAYALNLNGTVTILNGDGSTTDIDLIQRMLKLYDKDKSGYVTIDLKHSEKFQPGMIVELLTPEEITNFIQGKTNQELSKLLQLESNFDTAKRNNNGSVGDYIAIRRAGAQLDACIMGYTLDMKQEGEIRNTTLTTGQYIIYFVARDTFTNNNDSALSYNRDYHWYRLDSNGIWSDKPGSNPVKNREIYGVRYNNGPITYYYGNNITDPTLQSARSRIVYHNHPDGSQTIEYASNYYIPLEFYIVTPR